MVLRRTIFPGGLSPDLLSGFDLSDKSSLQVLVIAVSCVCMALIAISVGLRLVVRRVYSARFFLDDALIVLAAILTLVVCSTVLVATKHGLGKHVWNMDSTTIISELKLLIQLMFVANIAYAAAIAFTKLSIIASYMHIFAPRGHLRTALLATGGITVGLAIASIPATVFECTPVAAAWAITDTNGRATCYPFVNFLYASTAINVMTDLMLCIAPIPLFWALQLPRRQKVIVSVLFFLGGFACIASIVRLAYLHLLAAPIDVTWVLVPCVMWSVAECTIGIVCVSLPPLRPLLARVLPSIFRGPQLYDRRTHQGVFAGFDINGGTPVVGTTMADRTPGTVVSKRLSGAFPASVSPLQLSTKSKCKNSTHTDVLHMFPKPGTGCGAAPSVPSLAPTDKERFDKDSDSSTIIDSAPSGVSRPASAAAPSVSHSLLLPDPAVQLRQLQELQNSNRLSHTVSEAEMGLIRVPTGASNATRPDSRDRLDAAWDQR